VWCVLASLALAPSVAAQHVLRGRVVDTSGLGLAGIEVVIAAAQRQGLTDSTGHFRLAGIPAGQYQLVFRRLGYQPLVIFRSFVGDTGTVVVDARLVAEAVVLPDVETNVRGPANVPVRLREWARRREYNVGGKFWDDSLLRKQEHRRLPEVLQRVSGARIIRGPSGRYLAIGGGRAGYTLGVTRRPLNPGIPRACFSDIYLDGAKLGAGGEPPNLDNIPVSQIAAMEFYRSASEMPVEFNQTGSVCGVLAIWTR
jgi:hypothetical protein